MNFDSPQERSAAAAEFVLGTLEPAEQQAFAARLRHDRQLEAEVFAWQDRLLGLAARATPVEPTPRLWPRIEQALAGRAAPRGDDVARPPWWQRLGLWQSVSGVALAGCAVLGTLLALRVTAPPEIRYVAVLQSPADATSGWVVQAVPGGELRLVPVGPAQAVPPDKSLQFWTKPQGAAGPTSLGLVRAGQTVSLPLSRLPGLGDQQLFEITLEPSAGSPLGRPTGPVLYIGRAVRL